MTPSTSIVERVFRATKPGSSAKSPLPKTFHASCGPQLAVVLAACEARDIFRCQSASPPNRPEVVAAACRLHQRRLVAVMSAFDAVLKAAARLYCTKDHRGVPIEYDDAVQAARLGLMEAVDRYDVVKGRLGCVFNVVGRIRYTCRQTLLNTRKKPRKEVHPDWSRYDFEVASPTLPVETLWDADVVPADDRWLPIEFELGSSAAA